MTRPTFEPSETFRKIGCSASELRVMIAVMSHERTFGHGPTLAAIRHFLKATSIKGYRLIASGWLKSEPAGVGVLVRWTSTAHARRHLLASG